MIELDDALTVLQILVGGLQHIGGNGAALLTGQGVHAAACVVTDAQLGGRLHLPVHRSLAGGLGKAVLVVKGTGAAVLEQVGHGGERGVIDHLVVHHLEDTVDLVQPLRHRHVGIINGFEVSYKGLEKVVVRVDKAGIDKLVGGVDFLIVGVREILSNLNDLGTLDQHVRIVVHPVLSVAGHNGPCVADQNGGFHTASSLHSTCSRFRWTHHNRYSNYRFKPQFYLFCNLSERHKTSFLFSDLFACFRGVLTEVVSNFLPNRRKKTGRLLQAVRQRLHFKHIHTCPAPKLLRLTGPPGCHRDTPPPGGIRRRWPQPWPPGGRRG